VAVDNGSVSAKIFGGLKSKYCDVFGMNNDKQFVNTLWDVIRKGGAMDKLISDRAQLEVGKKVKDILHHLCIDDWQSPIFSIETLLSAATKISKKR